MITTAEEYYKLLYKIQDENAPSLAVLLPSTETIYDIDLATRKINAPEFLSVETDHRSEIIYFKVPRYYDNIDLTNTTCVIQYINAAGEGRVYAVPFYDVDTYSTLNPEAGIDEPMILFPWVIEGSATKAAGDVTFTIRFYTLDSTAKFLTYNLNTLPATSKVLHGMDEGTDYDSNSDTLADYVEQVAYYAKVASEKDLYWIDL
jgi:hypothetical protein